MAVPKVRHKGTAAIKAMTSDPKISSMATISMVIMPKRHNGRV